MTAPPPADGPNQTPPPPQLTRVVLRPIATPFPLAFLALATATLIVSGAELGWFSPHDPTVALILIAFAFAFPLQLIGCVFGFLGRDTVAATGFGVQATTWLLVGLSLLLSARATDPALGVFLLAAGGGIAIGVAGASLGKLVPAAVLGVTALRFALTGVWELSGSLAVEHVGAIVGLVLVPLAAYAALALEVENLERRTVLPLGRRGDGASAMQQTLARQTERVHHEAGVREQL